LTPHASTEHVRDRSEAQYPGLPVADILSSTARNSTNDYCHLKAESSTACSHHSQPSVNLHETFFCLYKLEQAKKAGKGKKCQSDLFLCKKLISGYSLKVKKPTKVLISYQKLYFLLFSYMNQYQLFCF
jgi:hypothetical protein